MSQIFRRKPRCGSTFYKEKEVSENSKIFRIKSGHEVELVGLRKDEEKGYIATLFVFELKKYVERNFKEIEKYLCHKN